MKTRIGLIVLIMMLGGVSFAQKADDILGKWLTEEKTAKIEIYKKNNTFFGKIVWLESPNNDDGSLKLDDKNPEESLRSRKIIGLELLSGFEFDDGQWEDGEIYDAKSGKTYSCVMTLSGNTLNVRGYVGVSWIGRTTVWTRTE